MTALTLRDLLIDIHPIPPSKDCVIAGLALDSRQVKAGDCFFAQIGTHTDGRLYISDAINKGAVAVLFEASNADSVQTLLEQYPQIVFIAIEELSNKIALIAARFYDFPAKKLHMIGVTGTNGKTSCSHFIAESLQMANKPCGVIGTLGNGFPGHLQQATHTTPNPIELQAQLAALVTESARYLAMEVSSHGLAQGRVAGIPFEIAVFTNLTRDHLDFHGTMENYAEAKRKLFYTPGLKAAVVNIDDPFGDSLVEELRGKVDIFAYSADGKSLGHSDVAEIRCHQVKLDMNGIMASILTPWGDGVLHSRLLGRFNLSNLLSVLATLCILGVPLEATLDYLSRLQGVTGRMQLLGGGEKPLVIVDYAHTPDALEKLLLSAKEYCQGQIWCVFGCGGDRDKGKRPEMGGLVERYADRIVVTDDNPRHEDPITIVAEILAGMQQPEAAVVEHDRARAIAHAVSCAHKGDIVLIAGKGHENYQQIGAEKRPFNDAVTVQMLLAE